MKLGSISSLGVGSGFELQQMLDDLRAADETSIDIKKAEQTKLTEQVVEFNSLNAKILTMKSDALSLSLESNFMERSASVDEDVALVNVNSGAAISSYSLEIERLASKNSFQTEDGAESSDSVMYAEPTTTLTTFTETAVTGDTNLAFTVNYETVDSDTEKQVIYLTIAAGSSIEGIVDAINSASTNINGDSTFVTATAATSENGSYVKLSSTVKDSTENHQILMMGNYPDFITPELSFSYQVGEGTDPVYVTIPPGATYSNTVSLINDDVNNSKMTAAMINSGIGDEPWHLTFTADSTGEKSRIFIKGTTENLNLGNSSLTMEEIQGADGAEEGSLNAAFSINGYNYQRQSNNKINDVIEGVSLTLKKADATQISIATSSETMKEKIINLIDTYNEINNEIDTKTSYAADKQSKDGIFSNVHSVKSIDSALFNLLETTIDNRTSITGTSTTGTSITGTSTNKTSITSLADLGMKKNQDGSITLDQSVLNEAFASSFDDVAALFLGDSDKKIKGLGDILNEKLRSMTNSTTGVVNAEKNTAEEKIDNLTDSIENATQRLDKKYDQMARRFIELDSFIGRINSEMNYLTSMLDSFNKTDSKN